MPTLWLTYAWKDNDDQDIDHVVHELKMAGVTVNIDRIELGVGKRLWDQIDKAITDPAKCDGWAIFTTRNSLDSEPCQEELAYALDRTLRSRGTFPLIGIFPEPLDRLIIPSTIAARLYVTLDDPDWATKIGNSLSGARNPLPPAPQPFHLALHKLTLEIKPRSGRWYPFQFLVPYTEYSCIRNAEQGPFGSPPAGSMTSCTPDILVHNCLFGGMWRGISISETITPLNSAFIHLNTMPSKARFGSKDDKHIWLRDGQNPR